MTENTERTLDESSVHPDPIEQFKQWYDEATIVQPGLPNAMSLATVAPDGVPSVRVVLLKHFGRDGFVFYTNFNSRKAREIACNPHVELCLHWPILERQVRVGGVAERASTEEADEYFRTRDRASQIGSHVSPQSEVVRSREELDRKMDALSRQFVGREVPRPVFWGGFRVKPIRYEFWQGRHARLHDRLLYTPSPDGSWRIQRLAP